MEDEILKYLYDAREAVSGIRRFVDGKTFDDYDQDELLRSAVERKFEVIGEALIRIRRIDPSCLERIRQHRNIISFRNILAHGYDALENRIVWGIISDDLGLLLEDLEALLTQL